MLGSEYTSQDCSIARALEAVGERWTLLVVRELLRRPRRFVELERSLGIAKNVLAARLDKLVALGVAERAPTEDSGGWSAYRLTDKGLDLFPVVSALMAWGDAHFAPQGAPAVLEHVCGRAAGYRLVCTACDEPVDATTVRAVPGPGYARRVAALALPVT